jgi:DNA-binding NarL/FixJ family response regulator
MTSIAIVEDKPRLAASLRRVVESTPDCQCVGVWSSGEEALAKVPAFKPDIVLMDIHMPGISGIEATARLKADIPGLHIVIVTVYTDHDKLFDAFKAGACGYLLKCSTPEEIRQAILDVRRGGAPMSPEIARRVVETFHRTQPQAQETVNLTKREADVLDLLAEGLGNKEIAARLGLSIDTVRAYLRTSYEKLHAHSRTEAAVKYLSGNPRPAV